MVSEMENGISEVRELAREFVKTMRLQADTVRSQFIGQCIGCRQYRDLSAGCLFDKNGDMLGACCKECHKKEYG
jgi:hypothetical protein